MAENIQVWVLNVGQGSGVFVALSDGKKITNTLLFDLGEGTAVTHSTTPASVKYVVEALSSMKTPRIDAVYLSHSDADHVNLIKTLLDNFNKPLKPSLEIGEVYFGGNPDGYKKGSGSSEIDYLKILADLIPGTAAAKVAKPFGLDDSSYKYTPPTNYSPIPQITLHLVAANNIQRKVTYKKKKKTAGGTKRKLADIKKIAYLINTASAVFRLEYGSYSCLITGDATGLTMYHILDRLWPGRYSFPPTPPAPPPTAFRVEMMTLPHHGSESTTFSFSRTSPSSQQKSLGISSTLYFAELFQPKVIAVSAGNTSHHHPSNYVMETISVYARQEGFFYGNSTTPSTNRYYTAYCTVSNPLGNASSTTEWPDYQGYSVFRTDLAICSTYYCDLSTENEQPEPHIVTRVGDGKDATWFFTEQKPAPSPIPAPRASWLFKVNNGWSEGNTRTVCYPDTDLPAAPITMTSTKRLLNEPPLWHSSLASHSATPLSQTPTLSGLKQLDW